eukprot:TRINITY_DN44930_c0_g1_i1.p1 TRINITY_DN44930_c0_g1~~TRINITY_DN44930_c0_g1_i1.p1  ORF type:complete len:663 (-),score=64.49 TRINITY_DN44930_c0_g1_i1:263-2191(-)
MVAEHVDEAEEFLPQSVSFARNDGREPVLSFTKDASRQVLACDLPAKRLTLAVFLASAATAGTLLLVRGAGFLRDPASKSKLSPGSLENDFSDRIRSNPTWGCGLVGNIPGISAQGYAPETQRFINAVKQSSDFGKVSYWSWMIWPGGQTLSSDFLFMPENWMVKPVPGLPTAGSQANGGTYANIFLGMNEPDIAGICTDAGFLGRCTAPCDKQSLAKKDCPSAPKHGRRLADGGSKVPTSEFVPPSYCETTLKAMNFVPIDGGVGRACGPQPYELKNQSRHFSLVGKYVVGIAKCQTHCVKNDECIAISYHAPSGHCELWKTPVSTTRPAAGYTCLRYQGVEKESSPTPKPRPAVHAQAHHRSPESKVPVERVEGNSKSPANAKGQCHCNAATSVGFYDVENCSKLQPLPSLFRDNESSCIHAVMHYWRETAKGAAKGGYQFLSTPLVNWDLGWARSFIENACRCDRSGHCACTDVSCGCPTHVGMHWYSYDCQPYASGGYYRLSEQIKQVGEIMDDYPFILGAIINEIGILNCLPGSDYSCLPNSGNFPAACFENNRCPANQEQPNGMTSFIDEIFKRVIDAKSPRRQLPIVKGLSWFNMHGEGGTYDLALFENDGCVSDIGEAYMRNCQAWGASRAVDA